MIIYPAIDIIDSKCVRLEKGDFSRKTVYSDDPIKVAQQFELDGATHLHVVDLDGTRTCEVKQSSIVVDIARKTSLKVQTGGGIRSLNQVETLVLNGVDKVVIGSLAVKSVESTKKIINVVGPERITLAFDVKIGNDFVPYISTDGWQKDTGVSLWDILEDYSKLNDMPNILCTDINRDGMLKGPNFELYLEIQNRFPKAKIQASGGINSIKDLRKLKFEGVDAAITGKAIYENKFTLAEALEC